MNAVSVMDVVLFGAILLGTLNGLRRRLSGELGACLSALAALYLSLLAARGAADVLARWTQADRSAAEGIVFLTTAAALLAGFFLLRRALREKVRLEIDDDRLDRVGGVLAGLVKSSALAVVAIVAAVLLPSPALNRSFGEDPVLGRWVVRCVPELREHMATVSREP